MVCIMAQHRVLKFASLLVLISCFYSAQTCHSFKNVSVKAVSKDGDTFNQTISGCFERTSFDDVKVAEIYVKDQRIPHIYRDSIRHLVKLKILSFFGCYTESIEPQVFRNVPSLWALAFIYLHLKTIQKGVFNNLPALQTLRLHNNEIDLIEDEAFANLGSLKKIYVSNNKLVNWNSNWFNNTPNVTEMDFQHNMIKQIPRDAFKNLRRLSTIFFDHNEITKIHSGAFRGIRNLKYLGLSFNRLTTLEANIFPNELIIQSLLIDANKLNYLSNEVLDKVSVEDLTIDGNPWKCPCLDRIHFWVSQSNSSLRSSQYCQADSIPVCIYPQTFSETCLEAVDDEVTKTYFDRVREATKDIKDFNAAQCIRFDEDEE